MIRTALQQLDRKLFLPFLDEKDTGPFLKHNQVSRYTYDAETLRHAPAPLSEYFQSCMQGWPLHKYHLHYTKPCVVEPTLGYAVTQQHKLIPHSLWSSYVLKNKPSFLKYTLRKHRAMHVENAIPLHFGWGNYWHFYNDILGALCLADEAGLPQDTPVLIAEGLPKMRFFQEIVAMSPKLQKRNWVLQSTSTYAHLQQAHFFNTSWNHRENFDGVLNYIGFHENLRQEPARHERIFVGRNPSRGRNILNTEEVRRVLDKYDFRYVECDDLTVRQQIDIFQHAAYVVGIHGAGLTNMIFRQDRPMKLLEIFSADYWNPCYYWLCMQYGYEYLGIVGSAPAGPRTNIGNFTLDIAELERQLNIMLA